MTSEHSSRSVRIAALSFVVALLLSPELSAAPGSISDGLRVWLRADAGITAADGGNVLLWPDQSGNSNDAAFNPSNAYGELPPRFDQSNPLANNQPSVRFEGENALELDLSFLVAAYEYTIFVVNARDRYGVANFYIGGEGTQMNTNLVLGYEAVDRIRFSHFLSDVDGIVEPYVGVPDWSIDTFRFFRETRAILDERQVFTREIYRDGHLVSIGNPFGRLGQTTGSTLGHIRAFGDLFWFQGDIAEVIIYDRALTAAEQRAVEQELAVRYGRAVDAGVVASVWTDVVPDIDGLASEAEWDGAGEFQLFQGMTQIGTLRFMNDAGDLYVFVDLVFDTGDDLPPYIDNEGYYVPGDYLRLFVDVNENGLIDSFEDWGYFFRERGGPCVAALVADVLYGTTQCQDSDSEFEQESFVPTPWAPVAHRTYEMALDLSENLAVPGETMRLGIWSESANPDFLYIYPPEVFLDFDRLFGVELAEQPVPPEVPIFSDGFEAADSP